MATNRPFPKEHPLHHASKELIAAIDFYKKMLELQMGDFASFESAWREFLQKIERVWNKAQAALAGQARWGKLESEIAHLRNTDPLLRYLRHARNADEHSIQPVATEWQANLRATAVESGHVKLEWKPWDRPLLPVRNRGVTYEPPTTHLGRSLVEMRRDSRLAEPVFVAELALRFYRELLYRVVQEVLESP